MIEKIARRMNLMFRHGFGLSRDPQKGYASTLRNFIELCRDETPPAMEGSIVIDANGAPVVEQLWEGATKTLAPQLWCCRCLTLPGRR